MIALPSEVRRLYSDLSRHVKECHLLFEFPEFFLMICSVHMCTKPKDPYRKCSVPICVRYSRDARYLIFDSDMTIFFNSFWPIADTDIFPIVWKPHQVSPCAEIIS